MLCPAGDLNSCPPNQEFSALVKELASLLILPGLLSPLLNSLEKAHSPEMFFFY
jgi:hypothetical protein